jgi:hypothetical protein
MEFLGETLPTGRLCKSIDAFPVTAAERFQQK